MGYNWKRALRKALTSFLIAVCPKLIEIKRVPTIDEAWVAFGFGVLAFALTIQKEEETAEPTTGAGNSTDPPTRRLNNIRKKIGEDYLLWAEEKKVIARAEREAQT